MKEDFLARINAVDGIEARFLTRVEGVKVDTDREATIARLEPFHREEVERLDFSWSQCWRAEQVHSAGVRKVVSTGVSGVEASIYMGVDGLISGDKGVMLGIYVADCGAIYLMDQVSGAIGLLHSGKKGTELGILPNALEMMGEEFGTKPEDVIVALAPCIRPPAYEVDFAADIKMQAINVGVLDENFIDCGICTSSDLDKYYSYRSEEGATGRMLALLGRK